MSNTVNEKQSYAEDLKTAQNNWSHVYTQDLNCNMYSEIFLLSGIILYIERNFIIYRQYNILYMSFISLRVPHSSGIAQIPQWLES